MKKKNKAVVNGPATSIAAGKFWNIANIDDDEAELDFYGEVVSSKPRSWWTGEALEGDYICSEDFRNDFESLKSKNKITVHINSVGGDLFTAIAIRNKLKELAGETVAIIDGIAASAATIIATGCSTIKAYPGSMFMIHEAKTEVWDMLSIDDCKAIIKQLDAANKCAMECYADKTGVDNETIKRKMANETWWTGREAFENGFVDEIIEDDENNPELCMTADRKMIISNGVQMSLDGFSKFPKSLKVVNTVKKVPNVQNNGTNRLKNKEKKEVVKMTKEELKEKYPDVYNEMKNDIKTQLSAEAADNASKERQRLKEIDEIANKIGDAELINEAKYGEKRMTAQELAFEAVKRNAAFNNQIVDKLDKDTKNSGVDTIEAAGNAGNQPTVEDKDNAAVNMILGGLKNEKR